MRRSLRLLPLALLALALGACGGGGGSGQDPGKLLKDTFGSSKPVKSGRFAFSVDVRAAGIEALPSPLHIGVVGPFQSTDGRVPKFDLELQVATRDGKVSIGLISTGRNGWVQLGERAYTLTPVVFRRLAENAGGTSPDAKRKGPAGLSLGSLGVDPRRWLRDIEDEGIESLKGAKVVHLSAGVDVPRLLTDLDRLLGRAGSLGAGAAGAAGAAGLLSGLGLDRRASVSKAVKDARVDIWTGEKDHQLRRIAVEVKVDTPAEKDGTIKFDLAISDLNRPQAIGPPANPRPLSELTAALAVLGRRRADEADRLSGSGAAQEPAPQSAPSTYEECIAAAGSDLAKAQQCSALLGE